MEVLLLETTNAANNDTLMPVSKFIVLAIVVTIIFVFLKNLLSELAKSAKRKSSNFSKTSKSSSSRVQPPRQTTPLMPTSSHNGRNSGELQLEHNIQRCYNRGYVGYFLHNLYVPTADGTTTEVDAVYVTKKGIFVFESKDYSGWIFGDDTSKQWMQTFKSGKKQPFPNPIWQNDAHIKCLGAFLNWKIPFFSFVVFSDKCEIKKMSVVKSSAKVIQQSQLVKTVINTFDAAPGIFSDEQLQTILQKLAPLTNKTEAEKDAHIANVQNRHNANENTRAAQPIYVETAPMPAPEPTPAPQPAQAEQKPICPLCGKELQERVAQNGDHAGQTYEVCADYPNCKYAKVKE